MLVKRRDAVGVCLKLHAACAAFGVHSLMDRDRLEQRRLAGAVITNEHRHTPVETQATILSGHRRERWHVERMPRLWARSVSIQLDRPQKRHHPILTVRAEASRDSAAPHRGRSRALWWPVGAGLCVARCACRRLGRGGFDRVAVVVLPAVPDARFVERW